MISTAHLILFQPDFQTLISPLEYWEKKSKKPKVIVDGHFKGWVNPEYIKKYNVPVNEVDLTTKDGKLSY